MQALIIIPSTIIATLLFVSVVSGENTAREIITGFYDAAETSVRPAQSGHVIHRECAEHIVRQSPDANSILQLTKYDSPVNCQSFKDTEVLISDEVANITDVLHMLYLALVGISFTFLVLLYPGKPFIGLRSEMKDEQINVNVM
jgi:hypothetical protein